MEDEKWRSLPAMLFAQADKFGEQALLWEKTRGGWQPHSWHDIGGRVRQVARSLIHLGIQPGDRVALLAPNGVDWVTSHFGIMAAGAISVPGYITHATEDYRHLMTDSGAQIVIAASAGLLSKVIPAADNVETLQTIIALHAADLPDKSPVPCMGRDEFLSIGGASDHALDERLEAIQADDTACLIYTSGTGGSPKGVMLTHRNILSNCAGAEIVLEPINSGSEVFLSFLPLNHAYEHMAGLMLPISLGAEIYFSSGADSLAGELVDVRPTIMTAVPRLFETLHRRISSGVEREGGFKARLFNEARRLGVKRYRDPKTLTLWERLLDRLCDRLVRRKVRARFGGRLKALVSGGGPLNSEIGLFFMALGITVLQGYGQTESSPVVAVNLPVNPRVDTVGPPIRRTEVRIAEDGEILVRGPLVMKGYWNDPDLTAKVLAGGWLHTGDVGLINDAGQLKITDRKRDFIKNSGGEMISPQRVEGVLAIQDGIAQAMVYGDRRPYLVALIVPDERLMHEMNPADRSVTQKIAAATAAANKSLLPLERVRRFLIATEPFTIENGLLTPTLKIKRSAIRAAYAERLETLYERETAA